MTTATTTATALTVPLLIRELRSENGSLMPLRPEVRAMLAYFESELHISFEIRRYPLNRMLANARYGEGLVFGLSKNKERLEQFHFSELIYPSYVWLVTRSDREFKFSGMADLKGKTIGVVRGTSYGDDFDHQRNVLFNVEEDISSHAARLKKLLSGRMDALLIGDYHAKPEQVETMLGSIMREQDIDMKLPHGVHFKVLPKPLLTDGLHFAIAPEKDDGIIQKLNVAIAKAKQSGLLTRLLDPS